ncbi:MAG: hypothetical protein IKU48_04855 [Clostridia bacterium]|nr:hypothetical protein [Clostridia bacterium]
MKKTSIVFLIISVILILTGIVIKNKSVALAEKENIKIYRQELTENGDLIETVEFSPENTNKINIKLKDTDVNVIGNAEKNYIEIINFNTLEYSAYSNNRSFNIENDIISALSGRAESGNISFDGIRDFVRLDKHNTERKINVYISASAQIKIFDIDIENGNVSFNNINQICDYNVKINQGNITLSGTPTVSLTDFYIKKGNISLDDAFIANAKLKTENGNVNFSTLSNIIYDYEIEAETGIIKINDETYNGKYSIENDEVNGIINAHVGVGNVTITTIAPSFEA